MAMSAPASDIGAASLIRRRILVRGAVQGVGFRPFVYRQATALRLAGWVVNSAQGVRVEAEGDREHVAALVAAIRDAPPANATVLSLETQDLEPCGETAFAIRTSEADGDRRVDILPDLAICEDCLRELFDPADRRYLYPFINCTHCGPRYSIIEDIPYDRMRTAMRHFPMCAACRAEYEDPADRRFHAEPNACPECGPRLELWDGTGDVLARGRTALGAAAAALRQGRIVAVKGIGGFHLLADARNEAAVRRLRQRKRRAEKPFAVMFPSLGEIAASCEVGPVEEALLGGPARPIVLLRRRGGPVAPSVAPGNPWLGALLPYAPLHHLLMRDLGFPVVATSGNTSNEPIVFRENEAVARLGSIADLFLVNDRPIVRPVDDSVVRVVCGRELMLRRARGYAPRSIPVKDVPSDILALGGHLKATVALTRAGSVVISQHLGDLEAVATRAAHARAAGDASRLFSAAPRLVVRDLHPDYASSRAAEAMGRPVVAVQHHLAHVAACMAERGLAPPLLGVAWDGAGYGPDGSVWGGEFLLVTEAGWRRVAHLRRFRLPGGEAAMREPRRAALGLLYEAFGADALAMTDLAPVAAFSTTERAVLGRTLARGTNAPWCSSAGRFFDAFAALCGLRQVSSYEGQAAAELEWAADGYAERGNYAFAIRERASSSPLIVDWRPALQAALDDLRARVAPGAVSAALHRGLAGAIAGIARRVGERRVILTGGCFQNALLTEASVAVLREAGFDPVWHRQVPPNDGGIALGQAAWVGWCERAGEIECASRFPDGS
jgi:hydrogenase maturation protein HypF